MSFIHLGRREWFGVVLYWWTVLGIEPDSSFWAKGRILCWDVCILFSWVGVLFLHSADKFRLIWMECGYFDFWTCFRATSSNTICVSMPNIRMRSNNLSPTSFFAFYQFTSSLLKTNTFATLFLVQLLLIWNVSFDLLESSIEICLQTSLITSPKSFIETKVSWWLFPNKSWFTWILVIDTMSEIPFKCHQMKIPYILFLLQPRITMKLHPLFILNIKTFPYLYFFTFHHPAKYRWWIGLVLPWRVQMSL